MKATNNFLSRVLKTTHEAKMSKQRTLRKKINPIKVSRTILMVRVTDNVSPSAYYPPRTHFPVDSNTVEAVLRSFRSWAYLGDSEKLLNELDGLRDNLIKAEKEVIGESI